MTYENISTLAASLSGSGEGKRNKKAQILSALLSASALGVFLEGCGGDDPSGSSNPSGGGGGGGNPGGGTKIDSESNPFLAVDTANSFTGSESRNWVSYAESNEGVTIDLNTDPATVSGGWAAGDTLTGIDNLVGSAQADTLTGNSEDNTLRGGGENDILAGGAGADRLYGGGENDILAGGAGADTIDGGEGTDTASYSGSAKGVRVDLARTGAQRDFYGASANQNEAVGDILSNIEILEGSDYDDWLTGGAGVDTLNGGGGTDSLEGGADADTLDGGAGRDYAVYSEAGEGVRVDLSRTEAQQDFDGTNGFTANDNEAEGDIISNIENIRGSDHADWLTGDGDRNELHGGGGDDRLEGNAGNDHLRGGVGADTIDGGEGTDTASYSGSAKGVRVDLSLATAQQDFEANSFGFSANNNEAVGDIISNIEVLEGSGGNDWLTGDSEATTIDGGAGHDRIEGGGRGDTLRGEDGDDNLYGGNGEDTLTGGVGNDILDGGTGADILTGGEGTDTLVGGVGVGGDTLTGGEGTDTLVGGEGADTYAFNAGDGTDTIDDDGGKIVFLQGTENDYDGATYAFAYVGGDIRLTVAKGGNTLNIIDFSQYPSGFSFHTRSGSTDTAILDSSLVLPAIHGSEGNPFLATADADTFTGSADADWVSYAESNEGVTIDLNTDPATVSGGWAAGDTLTGINNLIGSDQADTLTGNREGNTLSGGIGNDMLTGGAGADTIDGGEGTDTASYSGSAKGVRVDLSRATAQRDFEANNFGFTANNNEAVSDTLIGIENLEGSDHNDWLTGDSNNNELQGGEGDDRLVGGANADTYAFNAGDGTDTIVDDGGKVVFLQGTGDDYADATYTFDYSGVQVRLTVAKDGSTLNTIVFSQYSSGFNFYTRSSDGRETRLSLEPPPRQGSESNPFLATDTANIFTGSEAYDWVSYAGSGSGVNVDLRTDPATVSNGWAAGDTLTGINNVIGSAQADTLIGNDNDNFLEGGRHTDTLTGGGGDDTYVFNPGDGNDRINDDGGKVIFDQGTHNRYTGVKAYQFEYNNAGNVVLQVIKIFGASVLNTIVFSTHPSDFTFYTRDSDGTENEISVTLPANRGSSFVATDSDDIFTGTGISDTVSYAGSNEGVTIDLSATPIAASGGWADSDTLTGIENLVGSDEIDTLTGNSATNTLEGGVGDDILEGKAGRDNYIFGPNSGNDKISTDSDGGNLYFRGINDIKYDLSRNEGDVVVKLGNLAITIKDSDDADNAYGHGNYDIYYGVFGNIFLYRAYIGSNDNNVEDTLTGSDDIDFIVGLGGNDRLEGGGKEDRLDGGKGDDVLLGGGGSDHYIFDAGDGDDRILADNDGASNRVIFRAPEGVTYTNANFDFQRGNFAGSSFTQNDDGDDLRVEAFTGSGGTRSTHNTLIIEDYFDQHFTAYNIYRTGYDSDAQGTFIPTQPLETS